MSWGANLVHLYLISIEFFNFSISIIFLPHRFNGHEFEQAPGAGGRQGSLACCSPWCCEELDMTE